MAVFKKVKSAKEATELTQIFNIGSAGSRHLYKIELESGIG